jgi:hypothetical protein
VEERPIQQEKTQQREHAACRPPDPVQIRLHLKGLNEGLRTALRRGSLCVRLKSHSLARRAGAIAHVRQAQTKLTQAPSRFVRAPTRIPLE